MSRTHLVVVQPYVPAYRVPFFDSVSREIECAGGSLTVCHAMPRGDQGLRLDAQTGTWSSVVDESVFGIGRLRIRHKRVRRHLADADVIVTELGATAFETLSLALRSDRRLIVWGHGKSFVGRENRVDTAIESWAASRAAGVFVYTDSGRQHLVAHGVDEAKITVLRNSTDSRSLIAARSAVTEADVTDMRLTHRISTTRNALFVGGLDDSKRLPFLVAAAEEAKSLDPNFGLIVVGSGRLDAYLRDVTRERPWVVHIPSARGSALATIAAACEWIWMPGRIGLVAVDALALGLPVLSAHYPFHAPEADYLREAGVFHDLPDDPATFAQAALHNSFAGTPPDYEVPTIEDMARRFVTGVLRVARQS